MEESLGRNPGEYATSHWQATNGVTVRQALMTAAAVGLLFSGCGAPFDGDAGAAGDTPRQAPPAADGLSCASDTRTSTIYDYVDQPNPQADEPEAAVEAFFGEGIPHGVTLDADGTEVTVTDRDAAVATIGLMEVPGGYVVVNYDACEGAISGP